MPYPKQSEEDIKKRRNERVKRYKEQFKSVNFVMEQELFEKAKLAAEHTEHDSMKQFYSDAIQFYVEYLAAGDKNLEKELRRLQTYKTMLAEHMTRSKEEATSEKENVIKN